MLLKYSLALGVLTLTSACDWDKASGGDKSSCVAKVKRDYPVPPGNVNTLNQMLDEDCGKRN